MPGNENYSDNGLALLLVSFFKDKTAAIKL